MKSFLLFTSITFLVFYITLGQESSPKSYVDPDGKLYWNKSVPAYFWIGSTPDKPEHKLESQSTPKYANPHYFDTEGINFIRSKDAFDPETQKIVEPRIEVLYEIYVDGISPASQLGLANAAIFKSGRATFYGPGLTASLSASDAVSGVENIFLNINNDGFKKYSSPNSLTKEGNYVLQYYSIDNVGNAEKMKEESFVLDITAPESTININGLMNDNVISMGSKIYLITSDNLSGVKETYYSFDDGTPIKYTSNQEINFKALTEGDHTITYYSVDNVGNKENTKTFKFFFDKTGPLMAADVLGDRFIAGEQVYFSGRTKLKLTAVDNKVGVKEIRYSIDNSEFLVYDQPFYLPSVSGIHSIRYYSIDNMNNQSSGTSGGFEEFKHSVNKVYVDLTGPTVSHSINGTSLVRNDTVLIGPKNSIKITASDKESGLKSIFYSLNEATGETPYSDPLVIKEEGSHKLEYFAYDNVNNRNVGDFHFSVDATPPTIYFQFTVGAVGKEKSLDVYPASSGLFIVGTDEKAGLQQIFYSLNGAAEKPYTNLISGLKKGSAHTVKARAVDNLGNESSAELSFYIQK